MRLIDEAESIKNIEQFCDIPRYAKDEAEQIIRETNTVDAVPVVRCEECKSHFNWQNGSGVCRKCGINTANDFYCSYGERKDREK